MEPHEDRSLILRPSHDLITLLAGEHRVLVEMIESSLALAQDYPNAEEDYQKGLRYWHGTGIQRDHTEAFKFFRRAAERGHAGCPNLSRFQL